MSNITFYSITHRKLEPKEEKKLKDTTILAVGPSYIDDGRDNINDKNYKYCELTGLYDILANDKDSFIIALEHYRRYFSPCLFSCKHIKKEMVEKILEDYDVILPMPVHLKYSNLDFYRKNHYLEDLHLLRNAIEKLYPEVLETFDRIMKEKSFSPYNMFISTKDHAKDYATFIFRIFHYMEDFINIDDRDALQKRVFGFLGERLNYIYHMHYFKDRIKFLYVTNLEQSYFENFLRKKRHLLE